MRVAEAFAQSAQAIGFFPRREILALHVFDQRDLGDGAIVNVHFDARNFCQARCLCRTPATLAGDNHPASEGRPNKQRLEHTLLFDRRGQLG